MANYVQELKKELMERGIEIEKISYETLLAVGVENADGYLPPASEVAETLHQLLGEPHG